MYCLYWRWKDKSSIVPSPKDYTKYFGVVDTKIRENNQNSVYFSPCMGQWGPKKVAPVRKSFYGEDDNWTMTMSFRYKSQKKHHGKICRGLGVGFE